MLSFLELMDFAFARELTKKFQIDIEQIVREEYEMVLLKKFFESTIGKNLIFKGGTALRLCYGSPRFSQDLDFSLKRKFPKRDFLKLIYSFSKEFPQVKIDDIFGKRFTLFALFKIKEDYLSRPFSIKVEVSQRKEIWREDKNFQIMLVKSEVTPINFLGQIATLDKILEDKLDIVKRRREPRDLFDIWFVNQKLQKDIKIPFAFFQKQELKRELHKFLPRPWWKIIDTWDTKRKHK